MLNLSSSRRVYERSEIHHLSFLVMLLVLVTVSFAQPPIAREIFVPLDDLNVILESETQRVFITRKEYLELLGKAKVSAERLSPIATAVTSAEYEAQLEPGRAIITGKLTIEVLHDGLHLIPLALSGVGIRSAVLDDVPAILARDPQQGPVLVVQGRGKHTLTLTLTAPLATSAAQQTLQVELPHAPAAQLAITVPGNVEVKSGAAVIRREVDDKAGVTELELALAKGPLAVVLSLNNKLLAKDAVALARGVLVDEMTQSYERLHATISLVVLHGALEGTEIEVPEGFEITSVVSPLVSRWAVEKGVLNITLREPATDTVVLNISAVRNGPPPADWRFPRPVVKNVQSQAAVIGLLLEDRLQAASIAATSLVPIDTSVLTASIPPSVLEAGPGLPAIRPVVAYYAPSEAFSLAATFARPQRELLVTSSVLLTVAEASHEAEIGLSLVPRAERLFALEVLVPVNWQVTAARRADGQPLTLERYTEQNGVTRLHLTLPGGAAINVATDIILQATSVPPGWLGTWQEKTISLPIFKVVDADRTDGAIAVAVSDDLVVRPEKIAGLLPLTQQERQQFELGRGAATLAYRHEGVLPAATFTAERKQASIVAEVYNFHRLEPAALRARYELNYDIREAGVRELTFSLPAETPEQITIEGLAGVVVKDHRFDTAAGRRTWRVQLDQRRRGMVKIAVDLIMELAAEVPKGLVLPLARAEGVQYQTGLVSVEGHDELDVAVVKHPRKVDEGELYAAEYQVGARLVGAFGYLGDTEVRVDVVRHDGFALPTALSRVTRLVTQLGIAGVSQTEATFTLRTKAAFLEIELPPGAELWTITLDGKPTKPQKNAGRLLLSLPSTAAQQDRAVTIVFEQPTDQVRLSGSVELLAPRLLVREAAGDVAALVPSADAQWTLVLPTGYEARRSFGSVDRTIAPRDPAAWRLLKLIGEWGYQPHVRFAREAGRKSSMTMATKELSDRHPSAVTSDYAEPPRSTAEPTEPQSAIPPMLDQMRDQAFDEAKVDGFADPFGMVPPTAEGAPQAPAETPQPNDAPPTPLTTVESAPRAANKSEAPKPATPQAKGRSASQALQGVAGLVIGVQTESRSATLLLQSLGDAPVAGVILIRREPLYALAWALGLAVFGYGMLRLRSESAISTSAVIRGRITYVLLVLLVATLVPLLFTRSDVYGEVFDGAFFGGALTGVVYLALGLISTMAHATSGVRAWLRPRLRRLIGATAIACLTTLLMSNSSQAQPAGGLITLEKILPLLVEDAAAVKVPDDAVIIPFDSADPDGVEKAEKVLVPYAQYLPLWNLAHPDKKLAGPEPQLPYGIGAARYEVQLGSDESLDVQATLDLELFTEKPVSIPLGLSGGVLLSAKLDGAAARLQIVQPGAPEAQQMANAPAGAGEPVVLLYATGKGRKKLTFTYRIKLERQGGWRVARGGLPALGGAALVVKGPNAAAEIRLAGVIDRDAFETAKAGETIETALDPAGRFTLSWRLKQAENMVDRGVAVQSQGVFDVRQDVLRLSWHTTLEFPRSRRDRLTFETPQGYVVERVVGENVRAWEAKKGDVLLNQLEVTLLKEAVDRESITVYLARYGAVGYGEMATLSVPLVLASGAPLQQGIVTLRRDPLLDVRVTNTLGVTREDADLAPALAQSADAYDAGPIPVRPFQAYRFAALPATIGISVAPMPVKTEAEVQAILNVSERSTTIETRVVITPRELPVYRVDIVLPKDLVDEEINSALPGGFERSIVEKNGRRVLTLYAKLGQSNPFSVTILGKLTRGDAKQPLSVPQFEVLGVARQQGAMVVQADPAYDVSIQAMAGGEAVPVSTAFGWLQEQERPNARAAIRWQSPGYTATVTLEAKTPVIASRLFHNVRITPRTLEQTVIAEFQIREAGVREVTLLVPSELRAARILAMNARRTIWETKDKNLPAGFVRLRIELEDEFLGTYKVQLTDDQLISANKQNIPLPMLEVGTPQRRFLTIESAGRDEVIIEATQTLDSLTRGQQAYAELVAVLGGDTFTHAYTAANNGPGAALTLSLKQRETVETAAARIGLAETVFVLDRAGAYRAHQSYRVDNSSEQFLEVALPEGAQLWTTTVDGRPVKPVVGTVPGSRVRIPIIRRARGDSDYLVALIYAGKLERLGWSGRVSLPFPKSVNINVERSVVRLLLPEGHTWFNFSGTLGGPVTESGVQQTTQDYFKRQIGLSVETLKSGDKFARARAQNNLKLLGLSLENNFRSNPGYYSRHDDLAETFQANTAELHEGLKEAEVLVNEQVAVEGEGDNRARLNYYFNEQDVQRSKNVVGNDVRNFESVEDATAAPENGEQQRFSKKWLESNRLAQNEQLGKPNSRYQEQAAQTKDSGGEAGQGEGKRRPRFNRGVDPKSLDGVSQTQQLGEQSDALGLNREQAFGRYRTKLAEDTKQQQALNPAGGPQSGSGMGGMGGGATFNNKGLANPAPPGTDPIVGTVVLSADTADMDAAATQIELNDFAERPFVTGVVPVVDGPLGFASLDITIPARGQEFRFVTARGDLEITAQYIDGTSLQRWALLALSLAIGGGVFFVTRSIDWAALDQRLRWAAPVLLIAVGLISFLLGPYPLYALIMLVVGGLLLLRAMLLRPQAIA